MANMPRLPPVLPLCCPRFLSDLTPGKSASPQTLAIGKLLLEHGANPNADNDAECKECTLLSAAFTVRNPPFIQLLLAHKVDRAYIDQEQYTLLDEYASRGDIEFMQVLLDAGADINHKNYAIQRTPLMTAASSGNTESVRFLLVHHAKS